MKHEKLWMVLAYRYDKRPYVHSAELVVNDSFEGTSGVLAAEGFTFQFDIAASW